MPPSPQTAGLERDATCLRASASLRPRSRSTV